MKTLFLIAGHHTADVGAVGKHKILGQVFENAMTTDFRNLLEMRLKRFNPEMKIVVDNDDMTLPQVIAVKNSMIKEGDVLIDIHFNAFHKPEAHGTEVVVKNGASEKLRTNASRMSRNMAEVMGTFNRGVKDESQTGRKRIGILHGLGDRYLYEICFISNQSDTDKYLKFKHLLVDVVTKDIELLMK